ncbi:hypothetical protein PBY51_005847 [Eleginops maclovinus]|uniref:TGF-beta family profile domain-containing protein n=1 Tax=Eleginops maclovinus TaxID=56733 RepID=A0AAN7WTM2_ELEMC|nr:hypothetical protein PBY51_005847 [Eleginops maclovinus]
MKATRVCVLSCFIFLLYSTCTGVLAGKNMASHRPTPKRNRRSHQNSSRHKGAHHRPLTHEQKADQNLQFMLNLYQSAAEPDGRPKQHRKFGSNTVRLLRPSASSVHYLPASRDYHYSFTVQYNLHTLPSEQLIRASFIHLRSSPSSSSSSPSSTNRSSKQASEPPRCKAQITSLGKESLVTLEPHERWSETDITAHLQQRKQNGEEGHLTLTAQYWCTEPWKVDGRYSSWWLHLRGRTRWRGELHLEVPSLLLYLEQERDVKDYMLDAKGEDIMKRLHHWHPSFHRQRRSKELPSSDTSVDILKSAPSSSSSFSNAPSSSADFPNEKRKSGAPKNHCKLHSFRLSFDALGWGNYIAPPVYNPCFCQGNCPRLLTYGYHSPRHAIIQTIINDQGVGICRLCPACLSSTCP